MARFVGNKTLRLWLARLPLAVRLGALGRDLTLCTLWSLCALLPPAASARLGGAVVGFLGPLTTKQVKIRQNLRLALPGAGVDELRRIERSIWSNIGQVMGEYPHLGRLAHGAAAGGTIELAIPDHLRANFRDGRPSVFVTGHLANWEVLAGAARIWGLDLAVVYAPVGDGPADRRLRRYRNAMGARLIPRDGSTRELLRHLNSGRPVGIVADHREDDGAPLPFFDHTKRTSLVPARLALKTGADLVAVRIVRLGPARFRLEATGPIEPPDDCPSDDERATAMMSAFNRRLEDWILERPGEWQCGKRAFDKTLVKALGPRPTGAATHRRLSVNVE